MSDKKKILIVEDEEAMIQALSQKFKNEGFEVIEARDGEEGFVKAVEEHPDLAMLDIIMPKVDGITLLKRIRENEGWGAEVPVIMLSNLSDSDNVSEAARYKVFDFLVKTDWRLDDVVKLVKEKLGMI
jgi:DNA-binding response OmpR family regulator